MRRPPLLTDVAGANQRYRFPRERCDPVEVLRGR